ncbi:Alpha/Beta hydrolase protein [Tribonema minus]|uniref:Alpha/Beta hydrolase protein n=1 Tax=Tribonema minus TaxID=303371 RepID=A0A835Z9Z0_9STRA|nr:Alpha/Beta hydrolase protein [Tribonema minus]
MRISALRAAQLCLMAYQHASVVDLAHRDARGEPDVLEAVRGASTRPLLFTSSAGAQVYWMVVGDRDGVVAARGADSREDFCYDAAAVAVPVRAPGGGAGGGRFHAGFVAQYRSVAVPLRERVADLLGGDPEATVTFVGHSTGAAVAALACTDAAGAHGPSRLRYVGLGCPKSADAAFAAAFEGAAAVRVLVVNGADPVCKLFSCGSALDATETVRLGARDPRPDALPSPFDLRDHAVRSYVASARAAEGPATTPTPPTPAPAPTPSPTPTPIPWWRRLLCFSWLGGPGA